MLDGIRAEHLKLLNEKFSQGASLKVRRD